ncbi:MAG TPA: SLC13 family permease, partial [Rhodothermales bacterium]|nr:SLC13 family permease [Rhodothermales bacterium]
IMMLTIGVVSAFINNTAAVAVFIPVVISICADLKVSPSKFLIPISFASMLGGVCTLIGTSTNLLVSAIAVDHGLPAFSMFEFAPVGLAFLGVGLVYVAVVAVGLLPARRSSADLTRGYRLRAFITDVEVGPDSDLIGRTIASLEQMGDADLDVLEVLRDGRTYLMLTDASADGGDRPGRFRKRLDKRQPQGISVEIKAGDVLRIRGGAMHINRLMGRPGLAIKPSEGWVDEDLERGETRLVEAVVAPDSYVVTKPVRELQLGRRFGAVVLALRHHGRLERDDLGVIRLSGGDSLLLSISPDRVPDMEADPSFTVISDVGRPKRYGRMSVALIVLAGVVATAAMGWAPIVVAAVVGAVLLILTRSITPGEAYEAINWKVIFLLAGVLPLGTAMEKTGAAHLLAEQVLRLLGDFGPQAVLAGVFVVTLALTAVVTNNATAVLMAPIALSAAATLGVDPMPLLMAVTYAASLSFMTPMGYQTNTMVYGPGAYTFTDYVRVGTPLSLILLALGAWLIPMAFPF